MLSVMTDVQPALPAGWYDDGHGVQRWWSGTTWTEHVAQPVAPIGYVAAPQVIVQQQPRGTNHIFHLLMTLITLGLWIPVWIIVAIANAGKR